LPQFIINVEYDVVVGTVGLIAQSCFAFLGARVPLIMVPDRNGRENPSAVSVSVFYYGKWERERKQDIPVTERA